MNVYRLKADVEHYLWLTVCHERDWSVFFDRFEGQPIGTKWTPVKVTTLVDKLSKEQRRGDFPNFWTPVFSQRAVTALSDLLQERGELLPLLCEDGSYWIFNVTCVIDALDRANSDVSDTKGIVRHTFYRDRLRDALIFKVPQDLRVNVYVTDIFRERVEQTGLLGFEFRHVWSG